MRRIRNRLRLVLTGGAPTMRQRAVIREERARAAPAARSYDGLASTSLALASLSPVDSPRALNVLIGEVREDQMFAGIHTAIGFARALAKELEVPLRVVMLDFTSRGNGAESVQRYLEREFGLVGAMVVARESINATDFGRDDLWLATHFKTAHAAQVACVAGLLDSDQVSYLIQDYEPGFSPWSTSSVVAQATYHAGFRAIVNSAPLAGYLRAAEQVVIDEELVFAPAFDETRLRRAAIARQPGPATILFYARPSKPRNLYHLGIAALRAVVADLGDDASDVRFCSAGESHDNVDLGGGSTLTSLGRLDWDDYFDFLSETTVLLSLQASPHPSHPPFDAAISGAIAVTNDFAGTRSALHPRLRAVAADVPTLAAALIKAIREPPAGESYLPVTEGVLGHPVDAVITRLAQVLGAG